MLIVLSVIPVLALTSRGESQAEQPVVTAPTTTATATPALELIPAQPLTTTTPAPSSAAPAGSAPAETSTAETSAPTPTPTPTPAPSQAPPAEPVPCTDEMLALTVAPEAEYTVRDQPTLVLTVQNIGTGPCTRDLGEGAPEFLIFDGETRLWGSNDCIPGEGSEVRTLAPGESAQLSVVWAGQTAEPTCTADRVRLEPGSYTLRARLGTAQSPDVVLTLG